MLGYVTHNSSQNVVSLLQVKAMLGYVTHNSSQDPCHSAPNAWDTKGGIPQNAGVASTMCTSAINVTIHPSATQKAMKTPGDLCDCQQPPPLNTTSNIYNCLVLQALFTRRHLEFLHKKNV